MKKIVIAVFALMFAGVAYVGAQEVEIDFDGESDIQDIKKSEGFSMPEAFQDIDYDVPVPKREVEYLDGLTKDLVMAFWDNAKCIRGTCVTGHAGYACNLNTCGSTLPKKSIAKNIENKSKNLSEMLGGLSAEQKLRFYDSLMFRDGVFIGAYVTDIKDVLGNEAMKNVLRYFGSKVNTELNKTYIPDDYIKDAKCISPGTCSKGFAGYVCPNDC